ncbi:MAG: MarR family transcriptional regulator [Lachnospiraceae bacterium]|nr:MarR family transcriptional regulator [Lachnospiraceae bacterium]
MLTRFEMFSSVISGINRYIQKIERDEMVKYGYKGAYAQYLVALCKCDEGMTMSKLCEVCDKDKAAVSRMVTELVQKDLVVKKTQDNKTYKGRLFLTDKGREAAGFVMNKARKAVFEVGGELSDKEREILYKSLESISKNLKRVSNEGIE